MSFIKCYTEKNLLLLANPQITYFINSGNISLFTKIDH